MLLVSADGSLSLTINVNDFQMEHEGNLNVMSVLSSNLVSVIDFDDAYIFIMI